MSAKPIIRRRLAACRAQMRKHRIGALLISHRPDHRYLTGFNGEDSAVLILARQVHVITDARFDLSTRRECPWAKTHLRKGTLHAEIAAVCKTLRIKSLAVQPAAFTLADQQALSKAHPKLRTKTAPPITEKLRAIKSTGELAAIRKAIRVAEEAFTATVKTIRVGQTELQLAARLEYEMKRRGSLTPAFPTICAEGKNAALPHAHPGTRKIRRGSAILFDWGATVDGYCSDLTRIVCVGSIPPDIARIYPVVLEAQRRALDAIKPGARMCDVDAAARRYVEEEGFGDRFNHGLGHGIGLQVHEAPSLSWRSREKLVEGMVVTVEPGIYLAGKGGVRIEDDVLVTTRGRRVLSRLGKTLKPITEKKP